MNKSRLGVLEINLTVNILVYVHKSVKEQEKKTKKTFNCSKDLLFTTLRICMAEELRKVSNLLPIRKEEAN